ncbi:MAG: DUF2062 domain-containing protein [Sulfurovum sp.]|nr:DUF2062 domain-containing protein [Sulfurovum sp.]MCB4744074.1 DUF2062 domain-containing protein [Sulfurovum sp.]MCB4746620.1 DUF2062 domain-containing protein [Sulfurovum sp.]MCB4749811.1 DUF2062 domain-containing protein [Sulfurovum sp.]MCB4750562.1 DUF2062 domain-containing protein [Sulfurovum sp.]
MIRQFFKKIATHKDKFDHILDKYKIPKEYFNVNRHMITKGILVGLFWGFIPMPMQMAGVMITTPLMRFNVPIGLATVWLSNPITYPPLWYLEYLTGNLLMGRENLHDIELTMEWFSNHWDDIFIPLYIGTAFYSTIVSYLIYLLLNWLWKCSAMQEWDTRKKREKFNI